MGEKDLRRYIPPIRIAHSTISLQSLGEALHWIIQWIFGLDLVHYLDDFLIFNDPDPEFFGTITSYGLAENTKKRKDG
jgi:hypothetical protein